MTIVFDYNTELWFVVVGVIVTVTVTVTLCSCFCGCGCGCGCGIDTDTHSQTQTDTHTHPDTPGHTHSPTTEKQLLSKTRARPSPIDPNRVVNLISLGGAFFRLVPGSHVRSAAFPSSFQRVVVQFLSSTFWVGMVGLVLRLVVLPFSTLLWVVLPFFLPGPNTLNNCILS